MKNIKLSYALALLMPLAACADAPQVEVSKNVSIELISRGGFVDMKISNLTKKQIVLFNASNSVAMPDDPGLIIEIEDAHGGRVNRCAMINPAYEPGKFIETTLEPKKSLEQRFDKVSLARQYCMPPGLYAMRIYLRQAGFRYVSNKISFKLSVDVRPPNSRGTH